MLGSKVKAPFLFETFTTCTMTCPEGAAAPAAAGEAASEPVLDIEVEELPAPLLDPSL